MKRYGLLLMLALSACNENLSHTPPPMDHFFFPGGLALTTATTPSPTASGNQALLVVSANFDLRYDKQEGATLLSVDPEAYDPVTGGGGSAGNPNGDLVKFGPGAQLGSYAGPVAIADEVTCPSILGVPGSPGVPAVAGVPGGVQALVASRYTRKLYRFPLQGGAVAPCSLDKYCQFDLDKDLLDPAPIGIACRSDGLRRSAWVSYLRSPYVGSVQAGTAWLSEFDLGNMSKDPRTIALAPGPVGDMAYDALNDRLYAVGRFAGLTAPLFILDLSPCVHHHTDSTGALDCPTPRLQTVDLYPTVRGAELVGISLSNPQPNRPRLAYVSARIYDEAYASATFSRPPYDIGGVLVVVEIDEGVSGEPSARVRQIVRLGVGAGMVGVLPVRPGLGDLVVVPSSGDGTLQVFDDEIHAITRIVSLDESTGAPEAGRAPNAVAVEDRGTEALVYVAAFADWTVSVLRVPLATPDQSDLLRYPVGNPLAGKPLRIGRAR
jgi:hypothetical protein